MAPLGKKPVWGRKFQAVGCGRQEICSTKVQLIGRVTDCSKEQPALRGQEKRPGDKREPGRGCCGRTSLLTAWKARTDLPGH